MTTSTRSRLITALVTGLLAVGGLTACGGDDDDSGGTATTAETTATETTPTTTEETTTEETTTEETGTTEAAAAGKQVFTQNCASCHTLSDAGSEGQVGPNLDDVKPSESKVESQVRQGGGAMPAFEGQLSDAQIKAVAAYVASAAGS
jgi:mono/diheme cytochrome c family protein